MLHKDEIKQVIIIRTDLKMSRGKIAAQAAHASLMSFFKTDRINEEVTRKWLDAGEKKIVLKVPDEDALITLYNAFRYKDIPCVLVTDAGLTEIPPGSKTALGIGPWMSNEFSDITDRLKLL